MASFVNGSLPITKILPVIVPRSGMDCLVLEHPHSANMTNITARIWYRFKGLGLFYD